MHASIIDFYKRASSFMVSSFLRLAWQRCKVWTHGLRRGNETPGGKIQTLVTLCRKSVPSSVGSGRGSGDKSPAGWLRTTPILFLREGFSDFSATDVRSGHFKLLEGQGGAGRTAASGAGDCAGYFSLGEAWTYTRPKPRRSFPDVLFVNWTGSPAAVAEKEGPQ